MRRVFNISIKGEIIEVVVDEITPGLANKTAPTVIPTTKDRAPVQRPVCIVPVPKRGEESRGVVSTAMPGTVVATMVEEGQEVEKGQVLLVLEAMKMENQIVAPQKGRITSLKVKKGDKVNSGEVLCKVE